MTSPLLFKYSTPTVFVFLGKGDERLPIAQIFTSSITAGIFIIQKNIIVSTKHTSLYLQLDTYPWSRGCRDFMHFFEGFYNATSSNCIKNANRLHILFIKIDKPSFITRSIPVRLEFRKPFHLLFRNPFLTSRAAKTAKGVLQSGHKSHRSFILIVSLIVSYFVIVVAHGTLPSRFR
jgi:hypothetical protein